MKAKQIQAQYDAQSRNEIRHRSAKRSWMTGLAAAAAVLVFGTVTVGAVNNWDYSAAFSKYFSEKSGTQTAFDFSGMGLDIGETIEGEGFMLTVQAVMADASNLYIAYDVELSDEINAEIAYADDAEMQVNLNGALLSPDEEYPLNQGGASPIAVRDEDGVWHSMDVIAMEFGMDLEGKQLQLFWNDWNLDEEMPAPARIFYGFDEDGANGSCINLTVPEKLDLCYDLTGITVQQGMVREFGQTLPNDANGNVFDSVTVTPFMLKFESTGHSYGNMAEPQFGMVWGDDRESVEFTAVYADGTEIELKPIGPGGGGISSQSLRNPDGGYDWKLDKEYYIATPFTLEGLTEIRFNGRVITIA